jgi:undecaprenyl diphosphate synthase
VNARPERLDPARVPRHVAIIMDGNRRWAKARRLPVVEGHRRGIVALREATRAARDLGIEVLTVYGFSTENWRRDESEISLLLDLCVYFARSELAELTRNDVRVHVIGHYQALPRASREALERMVAATAGNRGLRLVLAINYSARAELRDAAGALAGEVLAGTLDPEAIDERRLAAQLYTSQFGDPELLIRPGGESRLSNFLLFQVAHAELYMTDTYWPDFRREDFVAALTAYQARRAAGGV